MTMVAPSVSVSFHAVSGYHVGFSSVPVFRFPSDPVYSFTTTVGHAACLET